jgi:hypothetical protein
MSPRTLPTLSRDNLGALSVAGLRAGAGKILRYELNVIASSVADVIQSAGGWLFDVHMAGWDVNVLVAEHHDERALQILGATTLDLHDELASVTRGGQRVAALAVATDLFATDERVREVVRWALGRGLTEVALWGPTCPWQLGPDVDAVQHRLSGAARAFKAHALAAAAVTTGPVSATEPLFRGGSRICLTLDSDLAPVS